ncbi:hypothetical protein RKD27_004592 [Streptomyces sp. SAI-126]
MAGPAHRTHRRTPRQGPTATDSDRLRSAGRRPAVGRAPAGVRMTRPDDASPWHVEIHVFAVHEARTVDVARAVRGSVERRLGALSSPRPAPRVTVTVTGLVRAGPGPGRPAAKAAGRPAGDRQPGKLIRATGADVGCFEPPSGSTVTPMPDAPSTAPRIRTAWSLRPGSIRPADRMVPSSSNHSW